MFSGHKSDRKNESCKGWKNSWPGNHTEAEFGRHLWKSSSPKLYSEQAQLNQVAQGHEHHQWWSLHDTYGQPALVPDSPHSVIKKGGFFTASVWSPTPCPVTDYPREESVCLLYIEKVPKTFSSLLCTVPAWSASPHQQVFQTLDCGGPWLDSLESIHIMNWGAQKWTQPCRGGSDQLAKLC